MKTISLAKLLSETVFDMCAAGAGVMVLSIVIPKYVKMVKML